VSARGSEPTDDGQRIAALSAQQSLQLNRFRDDRRFENIRQIGTITAMDFKAADPGYLAQIGPRLGRVNTTRVVLPR
jgi:adenosylmethionine-8-amino-7-oxononanoate aminotransferase